MLVHRALKQIIQPDGPRVPNLLRRHGCRGVEATKLAFGIDPLTPL